MFTSDSITDPNTTHTNTTHTNTTHTNTNTTHTTETKPVKGVILLIIDGMGAYYIYPELTPHSLDGSTLGEANFNLTGWTRVLNVSVPHPATGPGHSVIITGSPNASPETLETTGTETIFDISRKAGYLNIAVMETGDFKEMRSEQDIIIYDHNNSPQNPGITIQKTNNLTDTPKVKQIMDEQAEKISEYLNGKKTWERYAAYNQWSIDTANLIAENLSKDNRKFLLTVNAGGLDAAAHHLGSTAYIKVLNSLPLTELQETAARHNLLMVVTADHGMAFKTLESKGSHAKPPYKNTPEARYIPLLFKAPGTQPNTIKGNYTQQDITPTILKILELPEITSQADGRPIPLQQKNQNQPKETKKQNTAKKDTENKKKTPYTQKKRIIGATIIILINSTAILIIWRIWKK